MTTINFPKPININDYSKVVKEAKYDFDDAIKVLAEELKKVGVAHPENIASEIAYSYTRHCKWSKKFEMWTETKYDFDEEGYNKAESIFKKERSKAINSLMTLETTGDHPQYENIEELLETGDCRPIHDGLNRLSDFESRKYLGLIIHCLKNGGNGMVKMIRQYDSSPYFQISEEDQALGITNPN